jgi:hypothetical protein
LLVALLAFEAASQDQGLLHSTYFFPLKTTGLRKMFGQLHILCTYYIYILALYIYIVYNQVFSHKSFEINGKSLDVCHVSELMSLLSLSAQRPRNQLNDAGGDYTPLYAQKIQ